MVELGYTRVLGTRAERLGGSSPSIGTNIMQDKTDKILSEYMKNRPRITTEDSIQNILDAVPNVERRIFFDDKSQTVREQARVGETWVNSTKAEHIPYKKEYFARKLKGK